MSLEQIEQMVRAANPVPDVAVLGGSVSHRGHLNQQDTVTETDEFLLGRAPDAPTDQPGRSRSILSFSGEQVGDVDVREAHATSADELAFERYRGRRWMLVAAATIAVMAFGLLAVPAVQEPDRVQTDTVPDTPAPSSNTANTSALLPVVSSPATLPATATPATITPAPTPPPGEEITVTPDLIQLGDRLVGVMSVVTEDGRTYVGAGHFDGVDHDGEGGLDPNGDGDLVWFSPETFALAAFDDAGVELWRTELDWRPGDMVVLEGDLWVTRKDGDRTVARIDASDGRTLGQLNIRNVDAMVEAFGSLWVTMTEPSGVGVGAGRLVRIDPDLSTTSVEQVSVVTTFAECVLPSDGGSCPEGPVAGAGAMWLPLGQDGVAVIDPVALGVTVIPVDDIGHEVLQVAFDGDVAFVASNNRVTSIVDGEVVATVSPGQIHYVGPVDGAFGVLLWPGTFQVLRADDPVVVETRQISLEGETGGVDEIDGEAWLVTGRNFNLRRVEFLPISAGDG